MIPSKAISGANREVRLSNGNKATNYRYNLPQVSNRTIKRQKHAFPPQQPRAETLKFRVTSSLLRVREHYIVNIPLILRSLW